MEQAFDADREPEAKVEKQASRPPAETIQRATQSARARRGQAQDVRRAVQRKGSGSEDASEVTRAAADGVSGGGGALPHRDRMERGYGVDLGHVRAHQDPAAVQASRDIGAQAYTMGDDIAFTEPSPSVDLVAHEVAHVIQQRAGARPAGGVGASGDRYEREADAAASMIAGGGVSDLASRYSTADAAGAVQQMVVQRYESAEHAQTADGMQYPYGISPMQLPNGAHATRGELVAFGDFYQSYDMLAAAPRQETECLVGLIRWEGIWRFTGRQSHHTAMGSDAGPTGDPTEGERTRARENTDAGGDASMLDTAVEHADLSWTDAAWEETFDGAAIRNKALEIHAQFSPCWEFMGIDMPVDRLGESDLIMAHLRATLGRRRFRNTNNTLGSNALDTETPATTDPATADPAGHGGDYFDLASNNLSHFAVTNWATWTHYHKLCCDRVRDHAGDAAALDRSLIEDAWCCHFLTDMFATGHMLDKQELMTFATQMMVDLSQQQGLSEPGDDRSTVVADMLTESLQICFRDAAVYDAWRIGCQNAFRQNLVRYDEMTLMLTIPRGSGWSHGKTVVGNLVNTLSGMPWRNLQPNETPGGGQAEAFGSGNQTPGHGDYHLGVGNLAAKKAHDCLNAVGFMVQNRAGAEWNMKGDGHMTAATQAQAQRAVDESTRQIRAGAFDEDAVKQYMPWKGRLDAQAVRDYYQGGNRDGVEFDPTKMAALLAVVDRASAEWFELIDEENQTVSTTMRDLCHAIMEVEFSAPPGEYQAARGRARSGHEYDTMSDTGLNLGMLSDFLTHALPTMVPAAYASASAADMPAAALELYRPRDEQGRTLPTGANDFTWSGSQVTFQLNVVGCEPGTYTIGIVVRDQDSGIDYLPSGQIEEEPAGRNDDEVYGEFTHDVVVPAAPPDADADANRSVTTSFTLQGDSDHGEHYAMVYADASHTMVIGRSDARDSGTVSNPAMDEPLPIVTGDDARARTHHRATGVEDDAFAWDGNSVRFRVTHNAPPGTDDTPVRLWVRQFNRDTGYDYDGSGVEIATELFEPRDDDDEIGSITEVNVARSSGEGERTSDMVLFTAQDNDGDTYIIVYADAGARLPLARSNVQGTDRGQVDAGTPTHAASRASGFLWSGNTLRFNVEPDDTPQVYVKFYNQDAGFDYDTRGRLISGPRDTDSQVGGVHPVTLREARARITATGDANNPNDTYAIVFADPGCTAPVGRSGVQPD